jgi:hypothetical protein
MIKGKIYHLDWLLSHNDKQLHEIASTIEKDADNDIVSCVITSMGREYIIGKLKAYNIWNNIAFLMDGPEERIEFFARNRLLMPNDQIEVYRP